MSMKKYFKLMTLLLCMAAICMVGCSKDDGDTHGNGGNGSGGGTNVNAPASLIGTQWRWQNDFSYGSLEQWEKHTLNFTSSSIVKVTWETYYCDLAAQSIDPNYTPDHSTNTETWSYTYSNGSGTIGDGGFTVNGNKLTWDYTYTQIN